MNATKIQKPGHCEASHFSRALLRELAHAVALVLTGASVLTIAILLPSRMKTDALREQMRCLELEKTKLEADVRALRSETSSLDEDPWAIERALRKRLGFLRPGERVLKLER